MERNRYREFFSDCWRITGVCGNREQQDDMAGLISLGAMFLNHLGDQESGVEDPERNPHHHRESLESGLFFVALKAARLRKKILINAYQSS